MIRSARSTAVSNGRSLPSCQARSDASAPSARRAAPSLPLPRPGARYFPPAAQRVVLAEVGHLSYHLRQMTRTSLIDVASAARSAGVERVREAWGLTKAELAHILEVSPKTQGRRPLLANEAERLHVLHELAELAATLVPREHLAPWLAEPKAYLGGASPKELLYSERGRRTLEVYLLSLADSAVL